MGCAATTTIRADIAAYVDAVTDPDAPESAVLEADQTLGAAVASLEQLVEAAQRVAHEIETDLPRDCLLCRQDGDSHVDGCPASELLAALAAVGPGEEAAQ